MCLMWARNHSRSAGLRGSRPNSNMCLPTLRPNWTLSIFRGRIIESCSLIARYRQVGMREFSGPPAISLSLRHPPSGLRRSLEWSFDGEDWKLTCDILHVGYCPRVLQLELTSNSTFSRRGDNYLRLARPCLQPLSKINMRPKGGKLLADFRARVANQCLTRVNTTAKSNVDLLRSVERPLIK